jgi:hypothetical protein
MLFAPVGRFLISFKSGFACCAFAAPIYGHREGKELVNRATRRKIIFLPLLDTVRIFIGVGVGGQFMSGGLV